LLTLRAMRESDLQMVARWLETPHVARWYVTGSVEAELEGIRQSVRGDHPTHMLVVEEDGEPIGWCQWYQLWDYPDYAHDVDGQPGDLGIDYAIGDPGRIGQGVGTELIGCLVRLIRDIHPEGGIVADPDATNVASRRVLEKNGFELVDERIVPSDETDGPMAIYRLTETSPPATSGV
jgi:aminoglycoside 6'-N-acetyltransferase